jgi:hypothetical protein
VTSEQAHAALRFRALVDGAGHQARAYSGRGMYGDRCVAVYVDGAGDLFELGLKIGAAGTGPEDVAALNHVGAPRIDSMGDGLVAYWTRAAWVGDDDDDGGDQ